jgi:xanthine/uracil/vitamin C permease (AzgA family)
VILAVVMSDLFDNVGTSVSVGRNAGLLDPRGRLPRINAALAIDGLAAAVGGLMSASSNTTFIESNSGVAAGHGPGWPRCIVMPVTYSIANGVGVGVILHTGSELFQGRRVSPLLVLFSGFFVWYFLHGTI